MDRRLLYDYQCTGANVGGRQRIIDIIHRSVHIPYYIERDRQIDVS